MGYIITHSDRWVYYHFKLFQYVQNLIRIFMFNLENIKIYYEYWTIWVQII